MPFPAPHPEKLILFPLQFINDSAAELQAFTDGIHVHMRRVYPPETYPTLALLRLYWATKGVYAWAAG
jgi:hypothetical protein